jgi:hypothetical protein
MTSSAEQARAVPTPELHVPDFFIVGHPKCGTTALFQMLRRHPQLHIPVKEPWYFVAERSDPRDERDENGSRDERGARTLEQYLALFAGAAPGQLVGEATPSYLRSPAAASRIAALQPDARIIALFREPASFLHSFHMQSLQAHIETETDFAKALALEQARRRGEAIPPGAARPEDLFYSEHVRYVEQLRRYHAVFAPEQVLVLIYEDFRRDNEATVRQVLRFLEVDERAPLAPVQANPSVRLRSPRADALLQSLSHGQGSAARVVKPLVRALAPASTRRRVLGALQRRLVYGRPVTPDERLMRRLRERFRPEVVALSDYLGRDLVSLWGYDDTN